jgi:hypothetical protein
MSANSSLAIRIAAIFDNKGLKQAGKEVKGLQSAVKKLAGAAGIGLSTAAVINFGKQASKAFIADEKAASQLALSVKNLGLAFETPRIEEFISQLSRASGVTDDQLRPSMQKLLQTTGSVKKSTELLTQALDISRGSGVAYETVVQDLSSAYVGQTRGLRKYNLGLSVAELKTMSFTDVQAKLTKQFTGANAAYLETYAGKMGILSTAAGEAQEIIGKGLVDSLSILAGEGNTVQPLADSMEKLATEISSVITGLATMIAEFKKLPGVQFYLDEIFPRWMQNTPLGQLKSFIQSFNKLSTPGMGGYPSSALGGTFIDPNDAARKAAEAAAAKRAKELAALQKKTLNTQKQQLALTKAGKTLDIERIGLTAALRNQVSETDRLSLNLQLALLDKNEAAASKLSGQLDAAVKRQNDLAALLLATPEAANPYRNWMIPADVQAWTAASLGVSVSSLGTTPVPISSAYTDAQMELAMAVNAGQVAEAKLIAVEVYLDGDLVGNAIRDSSINQSLSGSFNSVNRAGRFDQLAE